jgi:uncharacterized protein YceK
MFRSLIVLLVVAVLSLSGCSGVAKHSGKHVDVKSVALVSVTVNNYKTFGWSMISDELAQKNTSELVGKLESSLSKKWAVKPAKSFLGNKTYLNLADENMGQGLVLAELGNQSFQIFSANKKQLIKGIMTPETAKTLCAALGVDAIVTFYSEWMVQTGKWVPTNKALTKNCISMYNKEGDKVFFGRKDVVGETTIGSAFSKTYVNQETVSEWVNASKKGMDIVLSRQR